MAAKPKKAPALPASGGDAWLKAFNAKAGKQLAVMASGRGTDVPATTTGILSLDAALGIGGWPHGLVIEVFGAENAGKTSMMLIALAACQALNRPAIYIDAEHKLNLQWAQKLGVDLKRFPLSQPSSGEEGFKALHTLIDVGGGTAIVDSVASMLPEDVIAARVAGKTEQMAAHAALMSREVGALVSSGRMAASNTTVIFLNQTRSKVGLVFGNPMTTTGGNALRFAAAIRIELLGPQKVSGPTSKGTDTVGVKVRAKIIKNQCAAPFKNCDWTLLTRSGLDRGLDLVETGIMYGVLRRGSKKSPAISFTEDGFKLGNGLAHAAAVAQSDPQLGARIRELVLEAANDPGDLPEPVEEAEVEEVEVEGEAE